MKVQVLQIPVKVAVERLGQEIRTVWKTNWDLGRHLHQIPEPGHVRPACGYYHPFVMMTESLCQNIRQEGSWRKYRQVQILPRQAQGIHGPCFGIGDWGHKLRQFAIVPGRKKVHLGKVPPVTDLSKDIWVKRPFCLNDSTVSGQFVGYHIEPAWNVTCSQANFSEIAPRQESPQESA